MTDRRTLLRQTADLAADFLEGLRLDRSERGRPTTTSSPPSAGPCPSVARLRARSSRTSPRRPIPASSRAPGRATSASSSAAAGVADLVERCCAFARRMADGLRNADDTVILNDIVLNQVLVRFAPPGGADPRAVDADIDAFTREVIAEVQADGTCWLGGTTWHDMAAMRISVSNWSTTADDIDASAGAIRRCRDAVAARRAAAAEATPA